MKNMAGKKRFVKVRLKPQVVMRLRGRVFKDRKKEQNKYSCRVWKKIKYSVSEEDC